MCNGLGNKRAKATAQASSEKARLAAASCVARQICVASFRVSCDFLCFLWVSRKHLVHTKPKKPRVGIRTLAAIKVATRATDVVLFEIPHFSRLLLLVDFLCRTHSYDSDRLATQDANNGDIIWSQTRDSFFFLLVSAVKLFGSKTTCSGT